MSSLAGIRVTQQKATETKQAGAGTHDSVLLPNLKTPLRLILNFASNFAVGCRVTKTATTEVAVWTGFLVVEADHARVQLHSTRAPADSV